MGFSPMFVRNGRKPWVLPLMGATLYVIGVNDAFLGWVAGWWLDLPKWLQTAGVVAILAVVAYFVAGSLRRRRSAYRAAVEAASTGSSAVGNVERTTQGAT